MDFLKNLNWTKTLKIGGGVLAGLFLLVLTLSLLNFAVSPLKNSYSLNKGKGLGNSIGFGGNTEYNMLADTDGAMAPSLSMRNIVGKEMIDDEYQVGSDAENFEVITYNANIETRTLKEACQKVYALKAKDYVIFENSNEADSYCRYVFKAAKANISEVLAIIEELDPKDLSENTRTIKKLIEDYTSETDILLSKKETIEKTLADALNAYDEISRIATQSRDASSLATIIDSKVKMIERLTNERINLSNQLDRINRAKVEELDRLEYVYFTVNISENKFIDGESLKDSWKISIKNFFRNSNIILQDISINLVLLIFYLLQYFLYTFIIMITLKYTWLFAKKIWKK